MTQQESTLDPATPQNWDDLRSLGHRMLDDMFEYLQTIKERPAWKEITPEAKAALNQPLPEQGEGAEHAYKDFQSYVLPYATHGVHPRFWGWVAGNGTPFGMLSEMLAAGLNVPDVGFNLASSYVELQVLAWCKTMLGYPQDSSGILVSGGSKANFVGLAVARNARAGFDIKKEGVKAGEKNLTIYASAETHNSVDKAVGLLGLGENALRKIPVDANYRIDLAKLRGAIAADLQAGMQPFCIVGNAGTVNTGAFDDLAELAHICSEQNLWFHVDGAFGAWVAIADESKHLAEGMALADSIAFDLHKWMYMQYEVGCCLVRSAGAHRQTFAVSATYLTAEQRGFIAGPLPWREYGIQLSREFRALKVWMSLKEHGAGAYRKLIQQNIEQAAYLGKLIEADPHLELVAPIPSNVVCFRFHTGALDETKLNAINREILLRLQEGGIAVPSSTILNGKFAIRAAITNHRSTRADFDTLAQNVTRLGLELTNV